MEFGRCFLSGSIAEGFLRDKKSIYVAQSLSQSFKSFIGCHQVSQGVCSVCRYNLLQTGYSAEDILSSAGRVACAISTPFLTAETNVLKKISSNIGKIMDASVHTRERKTSSLINMKQMMFECTTLIIGKMKD